MSACISRRGEFSDHEYGDEADPFYCTRCWTFDDAAAMAALERARAIAVTLEQDCARAWECADLIFSIAGQYLPAAERDRLTRALAARSRVAIKP